MRFFDEGAGDVTILVFSSRELKRTGRGRLGGKGGGIAIRYRGATRQGMEFSYAIGFHIEHRHRRINMYILRFIKIPAII